MVMFDLQTEEMVHGGPEKPHNISYTITNGCDQNSSCWDKNAKTSSRCEI